MAGQPVGQRHAFHEIAHDVDQVGFAADLVHADDVRMPQLRGGPGFAQELVGLGGDEGS
jgi:hypothetical protein